jgi:geranylgeranyl pyrophosphate synthase
MGSDPPGDLPDPFALVSSQLRPLDGSLRELVGSDNPVLTRVAQHFFELQGKRFRPTVVLLASAAANGGSPANTRQGRLAEITEMIHAASLLHDDVIDLADSRRGARAAHRIYGNKVAVLAGDFLLARASVLLSRLRDVRVVELLATTIEEMVHGELMQVKASPQELLDFEHYLSKTYRKTAALISLSCQASAMLGGHPPRVELALQGYGRHLGIAYQLVDDILDCTGSVGTLGKPALSDMQQGLATAPTLFAAEEFPQVAKIVQRRFSKEGDAAAVSEFVARSGGLQRARELASSHAQQAADSLDALAPSEARDALVRLCFDVLNRQA